jgi:hypothetical protein
MVVRWRQLQLSEFDDFAFPELLRDTATGHRFHHPTLRYDVTVLLDLQILWTWRVSSIVLSFTSLIHHSTVPILPMLVFTSPDLAKGGISYAIARKSPNTYILAYARAYGMAASREVAILNAFTPRSNSAPTLPLSASGKPLIWIDTDLDRDARNLGPEGGVLKALLAAEPPVIQSTGRTRGMHMTEGGLRDAGEVELLLTEDELARVCWYCSAIETETDVKDNDRFRSCGGEGYETTYMCSQVRSLQHILLGYGSDWIATVFSTIWSRSCLFQPYAYDLIVSIDKLLSIFPCANSLLSPVTHPYIINSCSLAAIFKSTYFEPNNEAAAVNFYCLLKPPAYYYHRGTACSHWKIETTHRCDEDNEFL